MYRKYIKRLLDIILSLIGLPFVGLAIVLFAPFIWLTDKGTVFYTAPRRGFKGKIFKMYKLRSMYMNAPVIKNGRWVNVPAIPIRSTKTEEFCERPPWMNVNAECARRYEFYWAS